MNTWVRRSLSAGALTAGAVMACGTAAHAADTTLISQDNIGILNGTQVFSPIQAPINLCGVAAAVGGKALAGCEGGSAASINGLYDATMISQDNVGILNGTQVLAPIQVPMNVCGVAVPVLGQAFAGCAGGASATLGQGVHDRKDHKGHKGGGHHYEESESIPEGCGTTCPPPSAPPANENPDDCPPAHHHGSKPGSHHGTGKHRKHDNDGVTMTSAGNIGILNGTQVYAPIQVPVDVSGVAVGVLGHASAWSLGGSSARM
jgi:hypothetical protein